VRAFLVSGAYLMPKMHGFGAYYKRTYRDQAISAKCRGVALFWSVRTCELVETGLAL